MSRHGLDKVIVNLTQELTANELRAREIARRFETLQRILESLKIDVFQSCLEEQRKSRACYRGFASLIKDKKKIRDSLLVAAGILVLGGLLTRDKFGAITAGMSSFDGMVQGLGESKWYILLGEKISIVPEETIPPQASMMTLNSFCIELAGEKLGNLDNVISKLTKKPRLIHD